MERKEKEIIVNLSKIKKRGKESEKEARQRQKGM